MLKLSTGFGEGNAGLPMVSKPKVGMNQCFRHRHIPGLNSGDSQRIWVLSIMPGTSAGMIDSITSSN